MAISNKTRARREDARQILTENIFDMRNANRRARETLNACERRCQDRTAKALSLLWPEFDITDARERFENFLRENNISRRDDVTARIVDDIIVHLDAYVRRLADGDDFDLVFDELFATTFITFQIGNGESELNLDSDVQYVEQLKTLNRQLEPYRTSGCIPWSIRCSELRVLLGTRYLDLRFIS